MVTVSIQPFAPKRIFLLVAAIVCLASAACFADPLYMNVRSTPYDRQMTRIAPVLLSDQTANDGLSLSLVNDWMQELRGIPYGFSQEWKTPEEVGNGAPADCKGKAVALYHLMRSHGAADLRLVIGKRTLASQTTHAWLTWEKDGTSYVLDPTINWMAYRAEVTDGMYLPFYAYDGGRKYQAVPALLFAKI
ncbi:MAG: hypothetical protein ACJ8KU_01910 [Chthoniobacterales bacterium]